MKTSPCCITLGSIVGVAMLAVLSQCEVVASIMTASMVLVAFACAAGLVALFIEEYSPGFSGHRDRTAPGDVRARSSRADGVSAKGPADHVAHGAAATLGLRAHPMIHR